jgi:hypothetical protein
MYSKRLRVRVDRRIWLILVSVLAVLCLQVPAFADQFRVDEDFRLYYWMHRFQDPELFPRDGLQYGYVNVSLPWGTLPLPSYSLGYGLLFYAASFLVNPLVFSKVLPLLLVGPTVWYLTEYGKSVRNESTGLVLAIGLMILNLASPTSISVLSGLHRSFSCPLLIAFLYYLGRGKHAAAAATVVISALIFAPVFVLTVAIWGLSAIRLDSGTRPAVSIIPRGFGLLVVASLLGVLILTPTGLLAAIETPNTVGSRNPPTDVDSNPWGPLLWHSPKNEPGSRYPLFYVFPLIGAGGLIEKGANGLHLLILLSLGLLIHVVRGRPAFDLPCEIWCVLWGSLILFALDWMSGLVLGSFLLYLPSRYTRVGLFLFLSMFVLLNIGDTIREAARWIRSNPDTVAWLTGGVLVLVLGLVLLYPSNRTQFMGINMKCVLAPASVLLVVLSALSLGWPRTSANVSKPTKTTLGRIGLGVAAAVSLVGWSAYARAISKASTLDPPPAERELLGFLETLPKDVLLAGTPHTLDSVPLFAKRQILFSCEQISQDEVLMRKALDAYYAEETGTVLDFCRVHGVDYLVVNSHTYSEEYIEGDWLFFEPYNGELLPRVKARDTFALAEVPDDGKVFESGELFIVPCTEAALR